MSRKTPIADEVVIRRETPDDAAAVYAVVAAAFPSEAEAELVNSLRTNVTPLISLVAEHAGELVGHILFSPVTLDSSADLKIMGLAPMAVVPARQKLGIGGLLVRAGLLHCRKLGVAAVVVLGHAKYYPRFGFFPASTAGLQSEYDVPDEAFMVLELVPGCLAQHRGIARYHSTFAEFG